MVARNPVSLGTTFESEFVETWVPDAKPEGQFRWRVAFHPRVPGRWSYYLDHDLNWRPYLSEQVVFDVISDDLTIVLDHLEDLAARIESSNLTTRRAKFENFADEFLRLERAGIQLLTSEEFRSERGVQFSSRIDEIRRELGEALPEQPTAYSRKVRRSIKRDIAREVYRALKVPFYKQ